MSDTDAKYEKALQEARRAAVSQYGIDKFDINDPLAEQYLDRYDVNKQLMMQYLEKKHPDIYANLKYGTEYTTDKYGNQVPKENYDLALQNEMKRVIKSTTGEDITPEKMSQTDPMYKENLGYYDYKTGKVRLANLADPSVAVHETLHKLYPAAETTPEQPQNLRYTETMAPEMRAINAGHIPYKIPGKRDLPEGESGFLFEKLQEDTPKAYADGGPVSFDDMVEDSPSTAEEGRRHLQKSMEKSPYTSGPSGYEIASKITDNPYLGTAIATAIDAGPALMGIRGTVKGAKVQGHSPETIRSVADEYAKTKGLSLEHEQPKVKVNPENAAKIAQSFEEMQHNPNDPAVKKAYDALIKETVDQYKHIQRAGLKVSSIKPHESNPYKNSQDLFKDIHDNGQLKYFPTEQGFGSQTQITDHPLLQPTKLKDSEGRPLLANDVFRIVHDYFGHAKEGHSFGPVGEENAWRTHMPMYSSEAQKALTTETRGQNSWVNFGPHGEANRANPANTIYADQKAGILPDFTRLTEAQTPVPSKNQPQYADGGSVGDFDSLVDDTQADDSMSPRFTKQPVGVSFDDMVDDSEKYETPGQMAITAAEAAGRGLAGPLAPAAERMLGVKPEDILARQKANPIISGVGEAAGLGVGLLTGTGEAAVMTKAGELAAEAAGLGEAAKALSYGHKVGSAAVQQAAEMAVLQSGDEVSKMILQDPETTAETAIANVGMAAALGAGGGAFITGAVSPLWQATGAPRVEGLLKGLKSHLDGTAGMLPEQIDAAINTLGPAGKAYPHEQVSPETFYNKIQEVLENKNPMYKANITPYSPEDYAGFKTFLSKDGLSGYAVKPDGELISVFSLAKGRGESIVDDAVINKGAQKLDAFDINGKLPELYGKYMDETSRMPFADEYAPKDWDYNALGRPDVVMMNLNPGKVTHHLSQGALEIDAIVRAAMSGNPSAVEKFNVLKEVQNKEVMDSLNRLQTQTSEAVSKRLGIDPADVEVYSEADAGHNLLETFKKEFEEKHEPLAAGFEKRQEEAKNIPIADEARLRTYGRLLEKGMETVGTDSPYYKLYNDLGNRLLAKDTVGGLDMLKTEINNNIKAGMRAGDYNTVNALNDIKTAIKDLQTSQIERLAMQSEVLGMEGAGRAGEELVAERRALDKAYSEHSKIMDELTNHLGIGEFKGAGSLTKRLTDKISPEDLLKKFSIRGNADFIPFLAEHFPETLKEVQTNELKKLIKPAVLKAKGEMPLDVKKLSDIISKEMAGRKEYVESILPRGAKEAVDAARMLQEAIPNPKSSGTAGWMSKVYSKMPQSAMAAVAMLTGHNPVFGLLGGEMSHILGRSMPDAVNLAYLKFLGSNKPIKSEAFKAMTEMLHNTIKGDALITKAAANVLSSSGRVLTVVQMPAKADIMKLDKLVAKNEEAPNNIYDRQNSHLGHYLPDHQAKLAEVSMRALDYLKSLKPHPHKISPLGKEVEPSPMEEARYHRALEIAQQPAVVLQRIKDGTLKQSDIQDLTSMYPGLYKTMAAKLTNEMINRKSEDGIIPYKTRTSLSLFLGQPVDGSMTPQSMQAIQATYLPPQPPQAPPGTVKPKSKGGSNLGKHNKDYRTPLQASEAQDAERK